MSVIVAKGLHKAYQGFSPVLRGVDITVDEGELVAIMGPSGCGKSTMLHILGMLHAPDQGSLSILDTDVLAFTREELASFRRENMGFVMQSNNLFEHSTVFENVEFPLIYEQVKPQERWERVIRALDLVNLSSRVHYRSNRLSGGEQQRVAIARAMVNAPRILLADEPTGALDARTSRLIMEIFRNLCHASRVAMVMVTHDPKMAEYCDSIYTLEEGVLVQQKHAVPPLETGSQHDFLAPPKPRMRGVILAKQLPGPGTTGILAEARMLYEKGLLARIYTLSQTSLLSAPEGYALPLAIRRLSIFSLLPKLPKLLSTSFWSFCRRLSLKGSFFRTINAVLAGYVFALWSKEESIDFLLASDGEDAALAAFVASELAGIPFGFDVRITDQVSAGYLACLCQKASCVRSRTHTLMRRMKDLVPTLTEKTLFYMPDPQTIEQSADTVRTPINMSDHVLTIAACGRMLPHKGFDVLLEACALLQNEMQLAVKIAGEGPELRVLKNLAKSFGGLHMVSFLGELPIEHMEQFYASADIFVAPQRVDVHAFCDDFPLSLIEAMSFGLPVIVTDLAVFSEVIRPGENGLVIPKDDAKALAAAIKEVAFNPDRSYALGQKGKEDVERMTKHSSEQEAFISRLLAFPHG
ncbi:MAG: glycosyltransferase [Desulfovibrio sp.]|nr:glycosyltransferase [Desulfovibrio sp.]